MSSMKKRDIHSIQQRKKAGGAKCEKHRGPALPALQQPTGCLAWLPVSRCAAFSASSKEKACQFGFLSWGLGENSLYGRIGDGFVSWNWVAKCLGCVSDCSPSLTSFWTSLKCCCILAFNFCCVFRMSDVSCFPIFTHFCRMPIKKHGHKQSRCWFGAPMLFVCLTLTNSFLFVDRFHRSHFWSHMIVSH